MATADVVVTVDAISVHVLIGAREVPLTNDGTKWTGSLEGVGQCQGATKTLRIVAPAFTDWSIVVKCDGVKALDDDGTTDGNPFSKSWPPANTNPVQP